MLFMADYIKIITVLFISLFLAGLFLAASYSIILMLEMIGAFFFLIPFFHKFFWLLFICVFLAFIVCAVLAQKNGFYNKALIGKTSYRPLTSLEQEKIKAAQEYIEIRLQSMDCKKSYWKNKGLPQILVFEDSMPFIGALNSNSIAISSAFLSEQQEEEIAFFMAREYGSIFYRDHNFFSYISFFFLPLLGFHKTMKKITVYFLHCFKFKGGYNFISAFKISVVLISMIAISFMFVLWPLCLFMIFCMQYISVKIQGLSILKLDVFCIHLGLAEALLSMLEDPLPIKTFSDLHLEKILVKNKRVFLSPELRIEKINNHLYEADQSTARFIGI